MSIDIYLPWKQTDFSRNNLVYFGLVDIDDCAGAPCQNNGTCSDGVNTYTCGCALGYGGTNCENGKLNPLSVTMHDGEISWG